MDIVLNNGPHAPAPEIAHHDYNAERQNAFSTATLKMGCDELTIFLPFGGRISYTNKNKE